MSVERIKSTDFTLTPAAPAPRPNFDNAIIPKHRYVSEDYMRLEWERMWTKVWLLGCREEDIANPGDYLVTTIGKEEIILVRQKDMSVRGFYNVCLHRGNRIMAGEGNTTSFKCQYHFWEYGIDGEFENIPDLETFPQGAPSCKGLREVRCDTWNSFVWFNMDPDACSLQEYLDPLQQHLEPYHFDRMVKVSDMTVEWDCNWKTSVDAFNESYHVQGIHPELLYFIEDKDVQIDCYGRHNRYLVPFSTISHRVEETTEIPHLIKHAMSEAGMNPADFDGRVTEVRKALQDFKRKHGPEMGLDYSDLNDDQLTDDYHYNIFPNLTLNTHADDLMLFRQRPHATDPNKMYFDIFIYKLLKKDEPRPKKPRHEQFKHGEKSLGLVLDQDAYNLPGVQAGMNSDSFEGLWIGDQELRIRHFHHILASYVGS